VWFLAREDLVQLGGIFLQREAPSSGNASSYMSNVTPFVPASSTMTRPVAITLAASCRHIDISYLPMLDALPETSTLPRSGLGVVPDACCL
jgi:hypothetical protein